MKNSNLNRRHLSAILLMTGIAMVSVAASASVPSRITDDTALYQNLSEIRVQKEAELNFDGDVNRLSQMESRYHENLPKLSEKPRVAAPLKRISAYQYRSRPVQPRQARQ